MATGNQAPGRFKAFRRLTRGVVIFPDETRVKFTLKPEPGEQRVPLEPKVAESIRIIITGVDPSARDAAFGDAKVAVSEIRVLGALEGEPGVGPEQAAPEAKPSEPAPKPEAAKKPEPKPAQAVAVKPKPEPKPKAEAKPEPRPEPKAAPKAAAKPKPAPAPKKKAAAKKPSPKKSAPKKQAAKPAASAPGAGVAARLRPTAEISPNKPLAMGDISPWLDLELVAQIKRYLGLLTTLHDSYPDLFAPSVRERERAAFLKLQDRMRAEGSFGDHHIAMLEHIGLSFDRPVEAGDKVTVRVHGPYRYYVGDKAWEFPVGADVTLVREGDKWLILDVRDR